MPISQILLPEFDQEMANTRKMLELYPADRADYQPHAKSMKLGRLAGHIAELPGWGKVTFQMDEIDLQPGQQAYSAKSRQELLDTFDKNVAETRELLAGVSDADLQKTWTLKFGGKTVFSMPKL